MDRVKFKKWPCIVRIAWYPNKRTALELVHENTGETIAFATVNIPDYPLPENHVIIRSEAENEGIYETLKKAGIIGEKVDEAQSGYCTYPVCPLLMDVKPQKS